MDPTPEKRQRARAAIGNINVQDANQLGELIGHLFLKISEHSTSATAHINTHADDITSLSNKLNKIVTDVDAHCNSKIYITEFQQPPRQTILPQRQLWYPQSKA